MSNMINGNVDNDDNDEMQTGSCAVSDECEDEHKACLCDSDKLNTVREGGKEFLVAKFKGTDKFTGKMLLRNDIGSLVRASFREFNGESFVYYDVSGKVRFSDMFSGENDIMERDDIERLCKSFVKLTADVRDHLLDIEETRISPETVFYDPENKIYKFLYIPEGSSSAGCRCKGNCSGCGNKDHADDPDDPEEDEDIAAISFSEGVKAVWDRVMEKFDHQSDMDSIARVYDIYRRISMQSFDLEKVFAPVKKQNIESSGTQKEEVESFSKDRLIENISGERRCTLENKADITFFKDSHNSETETSVKTSEKQETKASVQSLFEGLKTKLAGNAGFFSGQKTGKENDPFTDRNKRIEEISGKMDEEEKLGFKIRNHLADNSGNIFKVLMCVAVLFLIMAVLPGSVAFKPPTAACVGVFLVSVAVAVYARKLGKDKAESEADGKV